MWPPSRSGSVQRLARRGPDLGQGLGRARHDVAPVSVRVWAAPGPTGPGSRPGSGRGLGTPLRLSTTGAFAISGAAEQSFNVSVWPENSVVEHRGSIWLNCSHTCRDPSASGGLETSLTKAQNKSGPGWMAQELVDIQEWVSAPRCYFNCYGNVTCADAHITTYQPPERVVLEPLPDMELGRAYNLTCQVLNVAPVTHLTVTLRQGGRTLHTETFQNHTVIKLDNRTVTHEIIPQRRDHGQEVTCHTALDLRLQGQFFQNSSPATCSGQEAPTASPPGSLLGAFSILCPSVHFPQRARPSGVLGKPEGPAPPLCSQT
uniref:Intercellular adhesion molecule N-terminal domain-containing protein n=1 Tax=Chelonoidis abingdonii TaxID=106734 RepID=A0A8C0J3D4_CHEAB